MSQPYRKHEPAEEPEAERTVQSISISRRAASRSSRVNRGGKRTVSRGRRRFSTAIAGMAPTKRFRRFGFASARPRGTPWRPAKIAGILVIIMAIAAMSLIYYSDSWYVYADDVQVRNLTYIDDSDVYRASGLEGWHILWLTPDDVSEMTLNNPYVKSAKVTINLPVSILIDVEEYQPIALWVTSDMTYWLLDDGTALPAIAPTDESLPQLIDVLGEAKALSSGSTLSVNTEVLKSALSLMEEMPELQNRIRYNRNFGLNFPFPEDEVWVYWGDGQNTGAKMNNLIAALSLLPDREEPARLIDVRFIQRPYIR